MPPTQQLVIHPRAAPSDRLQVWLGALGFPAVPALQWFLDDAPVAAPNPLRQLQKAHDKSPGTPAMTGVFEFTGPTITPGSHHRVSVQAGAASATINARTLPASVPSAPGETFNVMLVSCYHYKTDKVGPERLISQLPQPYRPHLSLLMGDQVYLDLPTLTDYKNDLTWLLGQFERDYVRNWCGDSGYSHILAAAPYAAVPDDHEYWNNFPEMAVWVQNSWSADGRQRWTEAAKSMYAAFQLPQPSGFMNAFTLDVDPLSFFLLDSRTFRKGRGDTAAGKEALDQFDAWVNRLSASASPMIGVLATGQPLMEPATKKGALDSHIADFSDYARIVNGLKRLIDHQRPVLCVTGDVHWGRLTEVRDVATQRVVLREVISSPSSLVRTIVKDTFEVVIGEIADIFGKKDPWPRHSKPRKPPDYFAPQLLNKSLVCGNELGRDWWGHKGNQVAILSFRRSGRGIELHPSFWPIQDGAVQPVHLPDVTL